MGAGPKSKKSNSDFAGACDFLAGGADLADDCLAAFFGGSFFGAAFFDLDDLAGFFDLDDFLRRSSSDE